MEHSQNIKEKLVLIPRKPGIYQYFDKDGKIIYIGKAKDLHKRVISYFQKEHSDNKTRVMVSKIQDIRYTVVDNESDALLLENSLIKEYKPRYNILLKDDKNFPWVCIRNEHFPRVYYTRQIVKDGSQYFGPFTSVYILKEILELVRKLFPLRNCNRNLEPELIQKNKYSHPCLEFHLGRCKAPCVGNQTEEEYLQNINRIKDVFKGNLAGIQKLLKDEMHRFAKMLDYEMAQKMKDKIETIDKFCARSVIVSPALHDVEVFSYIEDDKDVYVNYLKIAGGAIVQSHNVQVKKQIDETKEEILPCVIMDIRQRLNSVTKEILVPFIPDFSIQSCHYSVPGRGDKLKLMELSTRNAKAYQNEKRAAEMSASHGKGSWRILEKLRDELGLNNIPAVIECFDNSNLQGTNPVASCVVFRNGKPAKSEYRMFHIKTVVGSDDFSSMEEIVYRRYDRMLKEGKELPGLVVVDGGKGQLSSALASLEKLDLVGKLPIVSIAKRLEEIYRPGDDLPLMLDKKSPSLKLIQQLRDEAHRFGITFHRKIRDKKTLKLEMEDIKGVGPKTIQKVYLRFGSVKSIRLEDREELIKLIGKDRAEKVMDQAKQMNS